MNPFKYEGTFNTILGKAVDVILLNLLWIVFSLPILTIGASTTAMYYTADKVLRRSEGYLWKSFWESFRENFRKGTMIWGISVVLLALLGTDAWIMKERYDHEGIGINFTLGFAISMVIVVLWMMYALAYTARFDNTIKQIMQNSFLLIFRSPIRGVEIAMVLLAAGAALYVIPIMVLLIPSVSMWYISYVMNQIYQGILGTEAEHGNEMERNPFEADENEKKNNNGEHCDE